VLTSEFAEKLGFTFALQIGGAGTVFVGRDVRVHSETLQTGLMGGLLKGGVDVVDCGLTPTPALLFALKEMNASAGVMVSGSHTPPEIAGVLFFLSDTGEMDSRGERSFERIFASEPWLRPSSGRKGSLQSMEINELYLREIGRHVGSIGGYRVVADPGNGATCATLSRALEAFGCSVTTINGAPDGRFPSRTPNPQPSTLTELSRVVREIKADFGIGTDSDGDRALFATEDGRVLWGDLTSALFAKNELEKHRGVTVITTINTSNIVKVVCQEHAGRLVVTRVGPPAIAEALRSSQDVVFATEESGKHIWPKIILYGDAALASGKLLHIMNERDMTLRQLANGLPKFYQLKFALDCPDGLKSQAMKFILDVWKDDGRGRASTLDGLKVDYPDLTWFLVRASGTEPLLRCSAEARNMSGARILLARATELALDGLKKAKEAVKA
jgi:phosphomannomutase / phosphoglucomutase